MSPKKISPSIADWPMDAQQAAQRIIDQYGDPDEITDTQLTWHRPGPWKRIVASRRVHEHHFPAPHYDSVESVIDYRCPLDKVNEIYRFDGSVIVNRTAGEVSARCYDEQANFLALNLMHDIVTGVKTAEMARDYYVKEFADSQRKKRAPYMEKLRFVPPEGNTADPDESLVIDEEQAPVNEQEKKDQYAGAPPNSITQTTGRPHGETK